MTQIKLNSIKLGSIALGALVLSAVAAFEPAAPGSGRCQDAAGDFALAGLGWLAKEQTARGGLSAGEAHYPTSMTALSAVALTMEGSTTTQGKYQKNIKKAVDYLVSRSRTNGLIGDPNTDDRYTYGHGFSMLFLAGAWRRGKTKIAARKLVKVLHQGGRILRRRGKP